MLYSRIEGEGKPLLILHGFLGMSDNWKTLGSQYVAEGYQVHLIDLRNHGRSFHSEEFSYELMVEDLVSYCNQNNLKKIDLLGHSMGGKVAMFFATKYPERVARLIVADIGPKYYRPHHQDILAGLSAVDFSLKPDRGAVEEILKGYITDIGTRQFLMKNLYWESDGQLAFRFNLPAFVKDTEIIGEALPKEARFNKPTLFLKGDKSNYILPDDFQTIQEHFPDSEIVTIANAGHWLHAENPKDFLVATIAFLKRS